MKKNILIACSGTGGHFYPGLVLAEELNQNHNVIVLINERQEKTQVPLCQKKKISYITVQNLSLPKKKIFYFFWFMNT